MDFLIIFSGYIIPATSYRSKLCFIINRDFYTTFVDDFYTILFKQWHSTSDTLFFTSFYLIMPLQNNPLIPTREFFAQSARGMQGVTLHIQYLSYPLCCTAAKVRLHPLIAYTMQRPHCLQRGSGCYRVCEGRGKCFLLCAVTMALIKDLYIYSCLLRNFNCYR